VDPRAAEPVEIAQGDERGDEQARIAPSRRSTASEVGCVVAALIAVLENEKRPAAMRRAALV
jgi:hypothetical protein